MPRLFDSHLHLSSEQFSEDEAFDAVVRALNAGVSSFMNVATDEGSYRRSESLRQRLQALPVAWYEAAATTPHEAEGDHVEPFFERTRARALAHQIDAIGETGLDYYYEHSPRKAQQELFHRYIELAAEAKLPLIIHCRDAFSDFFDILASHPFVPGVLHCFTGNRSDAMKLIDLGWYISISGIVTYGKSTEELRAVASLVPPDRLLVETDAPYLAPVPFRGKKNEPRFLLSTVEFIARLRGVSVDELIATTYENGIALFGAKGLRHQ